MTVLMRKPDAWLPLLISFAALALVLGYAVLAGPSASSAPHEERAPARAFQLLLALDALAIATFAWRRLPRLPREAVPVLTLQLVAAAMPIVTILILES